MNILILSCGTRNRIVRYFRNALAGRGLVLATDCSSIAPALYEADRHFIVPRITASGYIDVILDICRREKVTGVLSLIDPELSLIAKHRADFAKVGTQVIGSGYAECERCLDKWSMYKWLTEHGYRTARSFIDLDEFYAAEDRGEIGYPVFVKPVKGSASIAISRADDRETTGFLCGRGDRMLIQEFMGGQEIGADVYVDMLTGEVVSIFTKKKLVMRAGETDKAVSFKDDALFSLIDRFCRESGFRGALDIDVFETDGGYCISEVNPRFGGGYPHAYECGCDHMEMIVNNLAGKANAPSTGCYEAGMYMMKYSELMLRRDIG